MSPALFLFELLKMSKLPEDHWSCITYLSIEAGKKLKLKMWEKTNKKNKKNIISRLQEHTYILRPQAKCL